MSGLINNLMDRLFMANKVKVTEGLTKKDLQELKEHAYRQFEKKARYHNGDYLIDFNGYVLLAKSPAKLFEMYLQAIKNAKYKNKYD
jgi:hypothetical protein